MMNHVDPLEPVQVFSVRDRVRDHLRQAIIAGRVVEGMRLHEREVAQQLGVSTTPVKDAFMQLEAEGLLRVEPRRGIAVTFGPEQAREMVLARAAIEAVVARLAAERASAEDHAALRAVMDGIREATEAADVSRLVGLNNAVHLAIHDASRCTFLAQSLPFRAAYDIEVRQRMCIDAAMRERLRREHGEICDAIIIGDAGLAEALMRTHVASSGAMYVDHLFRAAEASGAAQG